MGISSMATLESYRSTLQDRRRETDGKSHYATSLQLDTHLSGLLDEAFLLRDGTVDAASQVRVQLQRRGGMTRAVRLAATVLQRAAIAFQCGQRIAQRRQFLLCVCHGGCGFVTQALIVLDGQSSLPDISTTRIPVPLDQEELYIA